MNQQRQLRLLGLITLLALFPGRAAWLDGYDRADDVLSQTVTIPADLTAATCRGWGASAARMIS